MSDMEARNRDYTLPEKNMKGGVVNDGIGAGDKQAKYGGSTEPYATKDKDGPQGKKTVDFHVDEGATGKLQNTGIDAGPDEYPKVSNEDFQMDRPPNSTHDFWVANKDKSAIGDLGSTSGPAFGDTFPKGIKNTRKI